MSYEYFEGYSWKKGRFSNYNEQGIDETCWLENEGKDYNKNDFNISVYLLKDLRHTDVYKVGISKMIYSRIGSLNSDIRAVKANHEFELVQHFKVDTREYAELIEKVILDQFIKTRVYKRSFFGGGTELFTGEHETVLRIFNAAEDFSKCFRV